MANPYFTLSHPSIENNAAHRYVSVMPDSLIRGVEMPRSVELAADGSTLLTLGGYSYRVHSLNVAITARTRLTGNPNASSYGEFSELMAFHSRGEATFVDWDGTTTYTVLFTAPRLEPNWITPDGEVMLVRLDMMEKR